MPMDFDSVQKAGSRLGTGTDDRARRPDLPGRHGAQSGALLRPGIVRLVHAVPRRSALGRADSAGSRGWPRTAEGSTAARLACQAAGPGHTFCALAPGAIEPLQSALKYFRDDFEQHIREHRCPSEIAHGDDLHRTATIRGERRSEPAPGLSLLGIDLPYFCWHPALGSVGACRQCAVKQFRDENDTHGRLVMACMTPAANGTRISIDDPEAREFRASVIEWLMTNHPHDCPVCDEGGECHLQDMTVMTGHTYRGIPFQEAHLSQPVSRPVRQPRDEPLHPVLPLRALLQGLRRRQRSRRLRRAQPRLFRPPRGWRAGERVQRQSGRGLPDRRLHRQDAEAALHPQVGPARRRRRSACTAASAAIPSPASATASCDASSTATMAR